MFELGARQHDAEAVYRDYLLQSDVFVGIYWQSYGWTAPGREISGLEDELRMSGNLPRLVYLKEPAPDRDPRLAALIAEVRRSGVATKDIASASELGEQLMEDLAVLMSERFSRPDHRLPEGTVTFMFADVEGSTDLLDEHGKGVESMLLGFLHDGADAVAQAGGSVVKTEGDGFMAVFADPVGALDAAVAVVQSGARYPYPGPLRARVGLHSGRGVVVDGDYVGLDVHRAARVGAAANGGQILMSAATRELTRLPAPSEIVDLGWYELRGISRPEHLHQLTVPGLTSVNAGVRARASMRAHVPPQLTSIVGRENDLRAVVELLERGVRLLTITGPGGIGKTRLALAAITRVEGRYSDGVSFVDLVAVSDPARVAETVVASLGRTLEGNSGAEDVIVDELRDRRVLLVLDNFESVAASAPLLRRLLERLPVLQILVTSRIALRLSMEAEYPLPPLEFPAAGAALTELAANASVRLLIERASAVRPDFRLTPETAPAVAELVRRLDGIPLAIELASARLRLLSPGDLLRRLDSVLDVGEGGADVPDRQRTLRAAIESSYMSLPVAARGVFDRLGVFEGAWSLEAAEAVVSDGDTSEVAVALEVLAANSLVRVDPGPATRMRMLSPLRDYARLRLSESGDASRLRERHGRYFAGRVTRYPRGNAVGLVEWKTQLTDEWDNIGVAVGWLLDAGDHGTVARVVADTWPLIWVDGRIRETQPWIDAVLSHPDGIERSLLGRVMHVAAFFALEGGEYQVAVELGLKAIPIAEETGDLDLEGSTRLIVCGAVPAFDLLDDRIDPYLTRAVELFRDSGDVVHLAYALNYQSSYQAATGDLERARSSIAEALVLSRGIEVLPVRAQSFVQLGFVDLATGMVEAARRNFEQAVQALETTPNREVLALLLDGHGLLAVMEGRTIEGLTAFGAAEGVRSRLGLRPWPLVTSQLSVLRQLADSFDDREARAARQAGRELSPAEALGLVSRLHAVDAPAA